ncbi:MAG: tetratricopeptide repeat protein [Myxococcales bacterium]|nr:tetratricopeptide repeat protein [Myxococcales bacterium]
MLDHAATDDSLDGASREVDARSDPPHTEYGPAASSSELDPSPGDPECLGRYRITERLGAGGMGVVYRAHDPELSRDVAIKQVHRHMARNAAARARLHFEACALAEVSHPNVVQVYDVGEDHDTVYISMEYVPGVDLQRWLVQRARPWAEVLAMFVAAGRGLAAAHERGLVHRDFKPSNVLVGEDGRPRVVDFGLAYGSEATDTSGTAAISSTAGRRPLTKTGTTMGTPAYMAPEQHRGEPADARSDQYAFCLSLFEGLYGVRPFRGTSVHALAGSKERGELPEVRSAGVPGRVRAVLRRGLRPDRSARWPSMTELLAALERVAHPRLRGGWRTGALVVTAGGLLTAVAVASLDEGSTSPTACPPASERLAGVWDADRAAALRSTLKGSGLAYADETWSRLDARLGAYADRWGQAYTRICGDLHDSPVDPAALDRQMACLGARRDELASLVEVLVSGQGQAVRNAVQATTELRSVTECDHVDAPEPTDGSQPGVVQQLRRDLLRAESLGKVARFDEGLALAEPALARATSLELPSLRAEALLVCGLIYKGKGDIETADARLSEGALLAASLDRHDVAARAAIALVDVKGAWKSHYDEALEWNRHAQASIERLGDAPELEARRLTAVGHLEQTRGAFDQAIVAFERALDLERRVFGAGHPRLAAAQSDLSSALVRAGRFDEGLEAARQALAAGQQAFGATHPEVGIMHSRLANAWVRQGDYQQSLDHSERAIAILEDALGPEHPNVSAMVLNMAQVHQRLGRLDEAERAYHRALTGATGTANEAIVLGALAELARDREDYPTALRYAQRSREVREAMFGPQDTMVVIGLVYEGLALALVGRDEDAFADFARARQAADVDSLPATVQLLLTAYESRAHLYAGRPERALEGLRRTLAMQEQLGSEPIDRADVRFHLVQALWALGQHDEARAELAVVDRELAPLGDQAEHRRRPIRAWIAKERVGQALTDAR